MHAFFNWILRRKNVGNASELIVKRVWVERNECLSHTLCIPEAPDEIEYDDAIGSAVVKESSLRKTKEELERLLAAADVCPMNALYLETQNGSIFNVCDEPIQKLIKLGRFRWAEEQALTMGIGKTR